MTDKTLVERLRKASMLAREAARTHGIGYVPSADLLEEAATALAKYDAQAGSGGTVTDEELREMFALQLEADGWPGWARQVRANDHNHTTTSALKVMRALAAMARVSGPLVVTDEAAKAALDQWHGNRDSWEGLDGSPSAVRGMKAALTAALPHLSGRGESLEKKLAAALRSIREEYVKHDAAGIDVIGDLALDALLEYDALSPHAGGQG